MRVNLQLWQPPALLKKIILILPGRDSDLPFAGSDWLLLADGASRAAEDPEAVGGDASEQQKRNLLDWKNIHPAQQRDQHLQGRHSSST